jgi:hypothetical protein
VPDARFKKIVLASQTFVEAHERFDKARSRDRLRHIPYARPVPFAASYRHY